MSNGSDNGQTQYCEECLKKQERIKELEKELQEQNQRYGRLEMDKDGLLDRIDSKNHKINKLESYFIQIDKINKAQDLNQGSRCIEIDKILKEVRRYANI